MREHEEDQLFRRPFHGVEDTQPRIAGLGYVLQQLQLFEGAQVMDFGCGTGWLSRVLSTMGMDVVGVDVSDNALRLARQFIARDSLAETLKVEFRSFDSITLPLEDDSVDRIVSFDAFHHVCDQERTLREMERVLRPGGIVVFHEPGPPPLVDADGAERDAGLRRDRERQRPAPASGRSRSGWGSSTSWVSLPSIHSPPGRPGPA